MNVAAVPLTEAVIPPAPTLPAATFNFVKSSADVIVPLLTTTFSFAS